MIAFTCGVFCLTLWVTYSNAVLLTGKNNQKEALRFDFIVSDITDCISRYNAKNIVYITRHSFLCVLNVISQCVVHEASDYFKERDKLTISGWPRPTYCGIIASSGRSNLVTSVAIRIKTYLNHLLQIEVNRFHFEWRLTGCIGHNIVIIDYVDNIPRLFCGSRLPWTLITAGHEAEIHISVSAYRTYEISSFYSSYKPQWFDSFAENHRLYVESSILSVLNKFNIFQRLELGVVNYSLLANFWQVMKICVSWNISGKSDTRLVVHDGPGYLSGVLVNYTDKSVNGKYHFATTAFSAFIQITNPWNENNNIKLTTTAVSRDMSSSPCPHIQGDSLTISSNHVKNTVCLFTFQTMAGDVGKGGYTAYMGIYVKLFTLNGPHIIVDDNPHNCHYGGMYISHLIDITNKMVPICDNKYKLSIMGRYFRMVVLIVWYAKYTSGSLYAKILVSRCLTTYLALSSYPNYTTKRSFIYDDYPGCQKFICAPKEEQHQDDCEIIFKTKSGSLGTSLIKATPSQAPYSCIPEYSKLFSDPDVRLKATINDIWPLGIPKTVNIGLVDKIGEIGRSENIFLFLYNATTVFNDICDEVDNMQIMLTFTISVCKKTSVGKIFRRLAGFINAASSDCYDRRFFIKHYLKNATYLLYKESTKGHKGGSLSINHTKNCPMKCRNYSFLLLILKRHQNRIVEYKLDVGNTVFIGLSHNGFRLTIQPPLLQCRCDITVLMELPRYEIIKQDDRPSVFRTSPLGDIYAKT